MAGANKKKHTQLSDKECKTVGCNTMLKQRIVDINPRADLCYKCYMKLIRKNPKTGMGPMQREKLGLL